MNDEIDYGIAIDRLRPGAKYLRYKTYADLVETWEDESPLPSDAELKAAYAAWEAEQRVIEQRQQKLTQMRNENTVELDVSKFAGEKDIIKQLAQKIAWLELEIQALRGDA